MIVAFGVTTVILWIELGLVLSYLSGIEPWSTLLFLIKHRRATELYVFLNAIFLWPFTLYLWKKDVESQWTKV